MKIGHTHHRRVIMALALAGLGIAAAQEEKLRLTGRGYWYTGAAQPQEIVVKGGDTTAVSLDLKGHIERVCDFIGLQPNIKYHSASAAACPSALADIEVEGNSRVIVFNPEFLAKMDKAQGTPWPSRSIIAHEIGHHLGNDIFGVSDRPGDGVEVSSKQNDELNADYFSGFVLARMGATLEEAQSAVSQLPEEASDSKHPRRTLRLISIKKGWQQAISLELMISRYRASGKAPPLELPGGRQR